MGEVKVRSVYPPLFSQIHGRGKIKGKEGEGEEGEGKGKERMEWKLSKRIKKKVSPSYPQIYSNHKGREKREKGEKK